MAELQQNAYLSFVAKSTIRRAFAARLLIVSGYNVKLPR